MKGEESKEKGEKLGTENACQTAKTNVWLKEATVIPEYLTWEGPLVLLLSGIHGMIMA